MATSEGFRPAVTLAVEGKADRLVASRLVGHVGGTVGMVHGERGKGFLLNGLSGYRHAARHTPWFVLLDLDRDATCPVPLLQEWMPTPTRYLCFRIAVRQIESWLLADAEALAEYLDVERRRIPSAPDSLEHPKNVMVALARRSGNRRLREDMTTSSHRSSDTGEGYAGRIMEFAESAWRPKVAAGHSESLQRAIGCLRRVLRMYTEAVT